MQRPGRDRYWRQNRHGHGGVIGGVILAGIGIVLLLQNLGIPYFEDLERYWPMILIVAGAAQASRAMGFERKLWGGVVVMVGMVFLLSNFGIIHGNIWRFLWPGVLILAGLGMLARALDRQSSPVSYDPVAAAEQAKKMGENIRDRIVSDWNARGTTTSRDHLNEWAVFGGSRRRVDSQDFQGGEAFAMFGGVEVDLRKAGSTRDEIVVELNAMFGGIEMRVPETWTVTVQGSGIFGGYEDETMDTRATTNGKQPHLIVNGYAIFGGVSIKN